MSSIVHPSVCRLKIQVLEMAALYGRPRNSIEALNVNYLVVGLIIKGLSGVEVVDNPHC
jgi:hypothetical protein